MNKNKKKTTEKLPMTGRVRKGFRFYCAIISALTLVACCICNGFCGRRPDYGCQQPV
jgi:hypothetical protein